MTDSEDQDKTRIQPRKMTSAQKAAALAAARARSAAATSGSRPADQHGESTVFSAPEKPSEENQSVAKKQPSAENAPASKQAPQKGRKLSAGQRVRAQLRAEAERKVGAMKPPVQEQNKNLQAHDVLKGRFILEQVLGAGGMGVVYRAKDLLKVEAKDRDPYVAIKVLGEEFKSHPEAFIALQRESRKTQRIAHPNIVNVHDFDRDGDTVFMTMEYMEGTPLDKLIKKYRSTGLPLNDVWQILDGLCSALSYAHDQNIIHSDLKPGNIFVTNLTVAKVFDFGIARAVAKAEQGDAGEGDKTVFDAGSLGALTPAYASLEMLEGDTPDVRDDIYALGCIAYELLTGEHPYKRKNAKEAKREGVKPKRIEGITKHQWKVIEQAIALERDKRVASVQEFWSQLTRKHTRPYFVWLTLFIAFSAVGWAFYDRVYLSSAPPQNTLSEADFRMELETKIRLELIQENIIRLLENPTFEARWESSMWQQLQDYIQIVGPEDSRIQQLKEQVKLLYLGQLEKELEAKSFALAERHLPNGRRYSSDQSDFDRIEEQLRNAKISEQQRQAEEDEERALEAQRQNEVARKQAAETKKRQEYERALGNINEQLKCNALLDMSDFAIAVKKLREVNLAFYRREEPKIVDGLAQCIQTLGRNFPDRAARALSDAKRLFEGSAVLARVKLEKKDPCSRTLAGLGSRGRRSQCQDDLASGGQSPDLVVIPGQGNIKSFAIGKYEVSVEEFNRFCVSSRACDLITSVNPSLPISNISAQSVEEYVKWLSAESGKRYRLPTVEEWTLAAKAKGQGLDSNRNCFLDSRGLQKGGALILTTIGQQNGWGLVNYVGNAREWVRSAGQYYVMGGSFKTDMDSCDISRRLKSNGLADVETGFRVLRELSQ